MAMPLVETKNLKKYFKTGAGMLHAVEDVNLKIMPGKTLGVVGESGCGKSTLGRTILRLQPATAGEVLYNGENILKYKGKDMQKIHLNMQMVFQDPYSSLDPRMSETQCRGNDDGADAVGQDVLEDNAQGAASVALGRLHEFHIP